MNEARPAPRGHCPKFVGMGGGRYVMDVLARRVVELGVDVRYDHRALALVTDDAHRVHGLILRAGGETLFARARKGVVLCTGGFVMNREMVRRHAPWMLRSNFPIGTVDDGSGIRLGVSAGGAAINMAEGFVTLPWYPPGSLVKGIFVNGRGQRFVNEDCYHGRVSQFILQQPGDRIWLLADAASYQPMEFQELSRVEIGAAGETWEEVERELGLPERSLVATVELYNRNAARGEDPLFHKAKQLAGAAREAAVRRARLPHRSLLLFELHPGRSRHLAYGRSAHRGSLRGFRALRRGPHSLRSATLGWRVQLGHVARRCDVLRAAGGSAGRKSLTWTYGARTPPSGAPKPSRGSPTS